MTGLFFVNTYNSVVDAPNWCQDITHSIENTRNYFKVANPGTFFRICSPINQVLAIAVLILFWRRPEKVRLYFGLALLLALLTDAFTFGYFYPRNDILFTSEITQNIPELTSACKEWQSMNWVRSFMVLVAVVFQFLGLHKLKKN